MPTHDPYRNFKFTVDIGGFTQAGFQKVTGLKETTEIIEYREGGENEAPQKFPGQSNSDPLVFERGMFSFDDLTAWRKLVFDADQQNGAQGDDNYRKDIVIYLNDKSGTRVAQWSYRGTWISELSEGDLDATGNDIYIESMTLATQGRVFKKL